ncbi:MAG: type II CRISPR RNA-guided endonuclease Cas9 [Rhodospirillaceae bacterium]|nr:type II CRISPR RNA-guided endonuclease Cas9 [Rhodospirillaceae bacterium]
MGTHQKHILGLDIGIGSCGWALIDETDETGSILALGVRTFDVPETPKERTPTNQLRREFRLTRRVTRRRAQRKKAIRALCRTHGLLPEISADDFNKKGFDPWGLRVEGLNRPLSGEELATVLLHIAIHRGFRSNSKRDKGRNAPKENSKMLSALEATTSRAAGYRTVGEMFATDPEYTNRKRNRSGEYSRSILRAEQEREIAILFERQRHHGNVLATETLQSTYATIAFSQRPIGDSEDKVGPCPFFPNEPRAAIRSYSFERFRLLSRLANLRLLSGHERRSLTTDERRNAISDFGTHRGVTFTRLRKLIALPQSWKFEGISSEKEATDVVLRSGNSMAGSYALRQIIGEAPWQSLRKTPDKLDRIAFVLSFRDDLETIRTGLDEIALPSLVRETLMNAARDGAFADFTKAAHISAAACRTLIPFLEQGSIYSEACAQAGFDHTAHTTAPQDILSAINNPIARKALTESWKQVRAIIAEYGLPNRIHIEMARDVGKSTEERAKIESGIKKRTDAKDSLRQEFRETVGCDPHSRDDLLRYELWKEQQGFCLYSGAPISPNALIANDNTVQVDHILPWSRSGDGSYLNKTLCLAQANQQKTNKTPFEWLGADAQRWPVFVARVEALKTMKGMKKRNYLLRDASVLESRFRERNLNDTRYACRAMIALLEGLYESQSTPDTPSRANPKRRIYARPGPLTDALRRAWGVQDLKKNSSGERTKDDRHHALDALIVAATSESALQRLTRAFQDAERRGLPRDFLGMLPPWPGFAEEARQALATVFISRPENHRARGKGHMAEIRQIREEKGTEVVYERKAVEKLKKEDLAAIKDPDRNAGLIAALQAWIDAGKPKDAPPLSPKGDVISKVRVRTNKKVDVRIRDGAADRGEMVRVDVFCKTTPKGKREYYLVPIYTHEVMNPTGYPLPPCLAIQGKTPKADWPQIGPEHDFLFSLRKFSFVEVIKPNGEVISGYFRGADSSTGALSISLHNDVSPNATRTGIGARTLQSLRKFHVDRLGRRHEIKREARTWHGVVCT